MSYGDRCMCGDICCPSCGPAQGNFKCPACGQWQDIPCDCTEEQIFEAQLAEQDALAQDYEDWKNWEERFNATEKDGN